jgi:iron complex transport system permease protein
MKTPIPYPLLILGLVVLLALLISASMLVGPRGAGTSDLFALLQAGDADTAWLIMREVRLPRTAIAAMEGITLGLAGAVLQGYLRNPLADPGVIGVSSGASLFAVIALYSGLSLAFPLALPLFAIVGALLAVILLNSLAGRGGMLTLILAGAAIAALAGAFSQLTLNLSDNPYAATEIVFWLMGSVTDRSLDQLTLAAPFMVIGWLMLAASARSLDALSLGEEAAASLGVDLRRTRFLITGGVAVAVGAGTAVTGGIAFVGLVVPHLLRPLVGHSPSRLLLASALGGGALLVAADILVRVIALETELKLGVVTALIGAPFFLWLIFKARTELES